MTQPAQIAPLQVPINNGFVRSFGHVVLTIAGLDFTGGFASIKYSRKRDRELPMSNSPDPIGKTLGENKYECSAVFYYDWWMNFIQTVEQNIGPGYGDQLFNIYVSYVGTNLTVYTDQIVGCTIDSSMADNQKGVTALTREVEFAPTKIYFAGIEDLADPLVGG